MTRIPITALILGLAGVIPFAFPLAAAILITSDDYHILWKTLQLFYALTILSFMAGALWGFAAKAGDRLGYALSTLPALYGFSMTGMIWFGIVTTSESLFLMALGFLVILLLDRRAAGLAQAPEWWMPLRIILTTLVVLSLIGGALI